MLFRFVFARISLVEWFRIAENGCCIVPTVELLLKFLDFCDYTLKKWTIHFTGVGMATGQGWGVQTPSCQTPPHPRIVDRGETAPQP